jgi:hypothetical protein
MPRQDSLQQFVALRSALERERHSLQNRLREIERVLGSVAAGAAPSPGRRAAAPARAKSAGGRRRRPNAVSLREAIGAATSRTPLSVRDIVAAVQKNGYRFQSTNPVNSVGAYLYGPEGKKHFNRADGKFSSK